MLFKWLDSSEAEQFGKSLAQFFIQKVLMPAEKKNKKIKINPLSQVDRMYLLIDKFKLSHKLNIYKKAKLGSAFKFVLLSAGYETELVNQVTKGLMQKL